MELIIFLILITILGITYRKYRKNKKGEYLGNQGNMDTEMKIHNSTTNYKQLIIEGDEAKCPTCGHTVVKNKSGDFDSFCGKCGEDFFQTPITKEVETPITKTEALKKLQEAKEHLELELITQDDYDKLKNELSPIIMSSSDEKSETTQPEATPANQKTIQQSQQKPSESKKRSKWVYIGIVIFILLLIGAMIPPTNSSSDSSSGYSSSQSTSKSKTITCKTCGITYEGSTLPYGKYCSQRCCVAYEGMSSDCGDVWNDLN